MKRLIAILLLSVTLLGILPTSVFALESNSAPPLIQTGIQSKTVDGTQVFYMDLQLPPNSFLGGDWYTRKRGNGAITFQADTHLTMSVTVDKKASLWKTSNMPHAESDAWDQLWLQEASKAFLSGIYNAYLYQKMGSAADSMSALLKGATPGWLNGIDLYVGTATVLGPAKEGTEKVSKAHTGIMNMLRCVQQNAASTPQDSQEALDCALLIIFWLRGMDVSDEALMTWAMEVLGKNEYVDLEGISQEALSAAEKNLGHFPTNGTFKEKAIYSAQYSTIQKHKTTPAANPTGSISLADVLANTEGQLTEMEKYSIASLYRLLDLSPPMDWMSVTIESQLVAPPMDIATATYALKTYNQLASEGGLSTDYQRMEAYLYKLQATMGRASGLLKPTAADHTGTSVTAEEISNFKSTAYSEAMSSVANYLYADVTGADSQHLGSAINAEWLYYLMVCYNEFSAYGTTLIKTLAPNIVDGLSSFASFAEDLRALKALYEAISWANDSYLWAVWSTDSKRTTAGGSSYNNLKSVYEYLVSINAFDGIDKYDPSSVDGVMRNFFGVVKGTGDEAVTSWQMSSDMRTGILASASFLPMRTNLYDPYTYSDIVDTSWLLNFHSKFGYNRKALFIDTNVDAAINHQRTGTKGELRVCTLEDLLYADKDIVLYLDDNLYNVNTLGEMIDKAYNRLDNVDNESDSRGLFKKFTDAITGVFDESMESIAKTAEVTTYSQKVQRGSSAGKPFGFNGFLFTEEEITEANYLGPDSLWDESTNASKPDATASTYTPLTAFAVVSAIYRDSALFTSLNTVLNKNVPVFISSPAMPYLEEADTDARQSIYNYLLLKNLDSQMSVDYATNLDMTSPIYMDIYGNIATESGLVVVPAAANASLWNGQYTPYNAAFFSTYGDDFLLEYDEEAEFLNDVLKAVLAPVEGEWHLASIQVNGGKIDLSKLSTADKESLRAVTEIFEYDLTTGGIYSQSQWQMIITEVLRGAPIEHINKDFEGLNLSHRVTKNGLIVAEKLEFLVGALSSRGTNTTLTIPNPAYMDGLEYVVFFAFKILILALLVIWMVTIYVDAVGGGVNLRTGIKCLGAVVLVLSLIVGIPAAFELSYYQSNKLLLQNETEYLMMLNLEKQESGQEIGITDIHEPDTNTTLYLKLADVNIPWYDLLPKILTSSTTKNLEALYADYEGQHPIAHAEDVTVINNAVYVSTDQLFDSSTITFSPTLKTLYQRTSGDTPASYYTPYYYFLDQIVHKANLWANNNQHYAYTTKVQRGGKLKTLGFIQPYFTSERFMEEGMDYFGLYTLYDVTPPMFYEDERPYGESTIAATQASQWCNTNISAGARLQRIEKLNAYCRKWVAEHKELIGKVTDETFLKSMALACAMEHNRLFNTMRADSLEIYELSNEDLMRLSIADHENVMRNSTMSYARFVFSVGGTPAVYAAALLTLVNFISSWVKPIATLLVFLITCISIFVFKLILRRKNNSIYGYICTILLMCSVNVLGSVFLKLSMGVPGIGIPPTVCILIQIIVQCLYIYLLFWIVKTATKDWKNVGFERYNVGFNKLTGHQQHSVEVDTPKQKNGWDYYNALVERQRRRHRSL